MIRGYSVSERAYGGQGSGCNDMRREGVYYRGLTIADETARLLLWLNSCERLGPFIMLLVNREESNWREYIGCICSSDYLRFNDL